MENSQVLKQNVPSSIPDHCLDEAMLLTIFSLRLIPLEQPLLLFQTSTKVCTSSSYCQHPQLSYTTAQKPRSADNFSLNHHFHITNFFFKSPKTTKSKVLKYYSHMQCLCQIQPHLHSQVSNMTTGSSDALWAQPEQPHQAGVSPHRTVGGSLAQGESAKPEAWGKPATEGL